jgi:uroporphyrinogen-III decarboxylase
MITGMARLLAAIRGEPCDRIPVFCNLLDQGAAELGISLEDYYANGESVAEAQLRMRAKYGYDNVWNLFYVGKEAEFFGCPKILFADNGPPNVAEFVIQSEADIAALVTPTDLSAHPAFAEAKKCLHILRREVGGRYPICVYLSSSTILPALLMGMDKWLELLLLGPVEVCDELLRKCSDFFRQHLALYRHLGADIFIYSIPFGATDMLPMRLIHERILPWMARDLEGDSMQGIVYYCGSSPFNNIIDTIIKRFNIGSFYLSPLADVAEGKRIIAGRALTCGVINDILLPHWSESQIRAEVKRILDAGMPGGQFLFGTLVMPLQIPQDNIRIMLDAAYDYGRLERV